MKTQFILSQCMRCGKRVEVKVLGAKGDHECPPSPDLDSNTKPS